MNTSAQTAQAIQTAVDTVQKNNGVFQNVASDQWKAIALLQALPVAPADAPKKKAVLDALMKIPPAINATCGSNGTALMDIQQATADVSDWDARQQAMMTGLAGMIPKLSAMGDGQKIMEAARTDMADYIKNLQANSGFPQ